MATWVEDEIGRKWDRCFTDAIFKFGNYHLVINRWILKGYQIYFLLVNDNDISIGGGILLGGVFSLFFFKRRKWPIITGAGFGLGMAYANCQEDLNSAIRQQQKRDCTKVDEGIKNS